MEKLLDFAQGLATILNVGVLLLAYFKFFRKPADNIRDRVVALEVQQKSVDEFMKKSDEKSKAQSETNEVLIHSVFALIEFEMQFCLTENKPVTKGLEDAKDTLHKYLYKS